MFDNLQLKLAENWGVLVPEFNPRCVTMRDSKYGMELVDWEKDACHRWNIVGYEKAQFILLAQQSMMDFLNRAVKGVLEEKQRLDSSLANDNDMDQSEVPKDGTKAIEGSTATSPEDALHESASDAANSTGKTPSPKWDLLVQNRVFSFGSSSTQSVQASANQPFAAPPMFDPAKTLELVESMYQASADELDLAQTDPAYLQVLVRNLGATAYFERVDSGSKWDWFMDEIVCNFYRRFIWWRQMLKECHFMMQAYKKYQQVASEEHRSAYEALLYCIRDIAMEHLAHQILLVEYRYAIPQSAVSCHSLTARSLPFHRGFERNYK